MDAAEKKRMEDQGYAVYDDVADWLGLTDSEREENKLRGKVSRAIRRRRTSQGLTQREAAVFAKTTQSRFAATESGAKASLDLMFRAFFALGGTLESLESDGAELSPQELAQQVERPRSKPKTKAAKAKS